MSEDLRAVDDALVRLRRLWSTNQRQVLDAGRPPMEMSSVLVVEACQRGAEAGGETTIGAVARFADVEHSTASRLVDRAAAAGLVTRAPAAANARRTAVTLTDQGRDLQRQAASFRQTWLAGILAAWDADDRAAFSRLLTRFADQVDLHGPPGRPRRD